MSILEEKIELAKMVLDLEDLNLIRQIKDLLLNNNHQENLEDLPQHVKEGVIEGLAQAERGELISFDEFKAKHFSVK